MSVLRAQQDRVNGGGGPTDVLRHRCAIYELWPNLGDGELRKAAYRGGWKPA